MSRRQSKILLPFKATNTPRYGNTTINPDNISLADTLKTPAKRRRTQVELEDHTIDENTTHNFEKIKGKLWSVYRLSQLKSFEYKPSSLPRYSRILSRHLAESFVESGVVKAYISLLPEMKDFESDDPPLYIKIANIQYTEPQLLYEGFLLASPKSIISKLEGHVHLPVLLARGTLPVRMKVHGCLQDLFSASIQEVIFPHEDMLWMIAMWSEFIGESKNSHEVDFVYQVPYSKDSIQCQYSVEFIKRLWNCVHKKGEHIVEADEVRQFHASLANHMKETIGLNLTALSLVLYKTPDFELHATGRIKVKKAELLPRILRYISDICETRLRLILS